MNNLVVFGCSFTEGFDGVSVDDNYERYEKFLGHKPKSWVNILAQKLGMFLINRGHAGMGNDIIFQDFCDNFKRIKPGDIVIYQWTYVQRFMVAAAPDSYSWYPFVPYTFSFQDENFSKNTYDEILYNRTYIQWLSQIKSYERVIEHIVNSLGATIYFWSVDNKIIYETPTLFYKYDKKYLMSDEIGVPSEVNPVHKKDYFDVIKEYNGGLTIQYETNGLVSDSHLGELGHVATAEIFYDHITKKKLII
jgi:hypothetical protein